VLAAWPCPEELHELRYVNIPENSQQPEPEGMEIKIVVLSVTAGGK
jgi:hypothetical protein